MVDGTHPAWGIGCIIRTSAAYHDAEGSFSHVIGHPCYTMSTDYRSPGLVMQGCIADRPGAEAEACWGGSGEKQQKAERHDVSSPG